MRVRENESVIREEVSSVRQLLLNLVCRNVCFMSADQYELLSARDERIGTKPRHGERNEAGPRNDAMERGAKKNDAALRKEGEREECTRVIIK